MGLGGKKSNLSFITPFTNYVTPPTIFFDVESGSSEIPPTL
ncbi:hypothetical protein O9992_22280 [Vibrio lentus]|nr:hypothetical protein [Vibrio lentus]